MCKEDTKRRGCEKCDGRFAKIPPCVHINLTDHATYQSVGLTTELVSPEWIEKLLGLR